MSTILIIDDEESVCWAFNKFLTSEGYEVSIASSAEEGFERVEQVDPDLIILDVCLPGLDGLTALQRLKAVRSAVPVILMTAHGTMQTAIEAMKHGAFEYLTKPVDLDEAKVLIERALQSRELSEEVVRLRSAVAARDEPGPLIGASPVMQEVYKRIGRVSLSDVPVLICGESGTGKELAAKAVHYHGERKDGPFVVINCASLPEALFESELFGHEKGAFTGAIREKIGKFQKADRGTLFLDEIGDMPLAMQAKALRCIEEKVVERVGGTDSIEVDTRIIAATNQDLQAQVASGRFREDLYYRLNVVTIELPPLRERTEDLPLLVSHFLETSLGARGRELRIAEGLLDHLRAYHWPGNVRELRNAIDHAAVLCRTDTLLPEHLPPHILPPEERPTVGSKTRAIVTAVLDDKLAEPDESAVYERVVAEFERPLFEKALELAGGSQVKAAKLLCIHRTTLRKKLKRYGL